MLLFRTQYGVGYSSVDFQINYVENKANSKKVIYLNRNVFLKLIYIYIHELYIHAFIFDIKLITMGIISYRIALCMQISSEVQKVFEKNIPSVFLIFNYNNNTMLNMEESKTLPLTIKG